VKNRKIQSSTRQHTLPSPPLPAFCTQTNFVGYFLFGLAILFNCHFLLIQLSMNCNSLFNIKCHGNEHYILSVFFFATASSLLQLERLWQNCLWLLWRRKEGTFKNLFISIHNEYAIYTQLFFLFWLLELDRCQERVNILILDCCLLPNNGCASWNTKFGAK
jgi:hypothetical protein